ncbi:MAG: molecular chaperone DnaJ [Verrucomicrobia bacterium]|nr:molecular chaperone DnaJ [Verrucomicrobiota bacterium]MDA1067165.1 molecular chaperone DnaJ [Verrucomicrobiota bacterium]
MSSERFATLIQSNPENEMFRFSYGEALFEEEKYQESLEHLQLCIDRKPNWMIPHILLGKAYIALGNRAKAMVFLEKALILAKEQHHEDPEKEVSALLEDLK